MSGHRGVHALLHPRNVVLLGATDRPGSWAPRIWESLRWSGFPGQVFPVSRGRDEIWGTRAYHDAADLPEPPDHVLVLLPAGAVTENLRGYAQAGARSATVISGGFGEGGEAAGKARAAELSAFIAETGLAVSGPNCLGNWCAEARLLTMTERRVPLAENGRVGIVGQSGGVIMAVYRALWDRGVGSSVLITSGNELGLTSSDYIAYMAGDDCIDVILAFVESLREPGAFRAACQEATAAGKRVVLVKVGESGKAREAAASHTGALVGSVAAFDAFMDGTGAVRVSSLDELVEAAELLTRAAAPAGPRAGVVVFSGGLKDLVVEYAERMGVRLPELSDNSAKQLAELLGVGTSSGNPLDVGYVGLSDPSAYLKCIRIMRDDPGVDFVLVQEELLRFPGDRKEESLAAVHRLVTQEPGKPVAMFSMISHSVTDYGRTLRTEKLPRLPLLQDPAKALAVMTKLGEASARISPAGSPAHDDTGHSVLADATRQKLAGLRRAGFGTLTEAQARLLLEPYGIAFPDGELTSGADAEEAAVRAASVIGYPVVLKGLSRQISHKTEAGCVELGISTGSEVRAAVRRLAGRLPGGLEACGDGEGVLVCRQVSGGIELIVGVARDPEVGLAVMLGMGGVLAEILQDTVVAVPPVSPAAAREMMTRLRGHALLEGYRGGPAWDLPAAAAAVSGVAQFALDAGDMLASLDVNPLLVGRAGAGALALDALVELRPGGNGGAWLPGRNTEEIT